MCVHTHFHTQMFTSNHHHHHCQPSLSACPQHAPPFQPPAVAPFVGISPQPNAARYQTQTSWPQTTSRPKVRHQTTTTMILTMGLTVMRALSGDVIELLIYHQPSVKPSLTLHPFGVLGYVAGHSLTDLVPMKGGRGGHKACKQKNQENPTKQSKFPQSQSLPTC